MSRIVDVEPLIAKYDCMNEGTEFSPIHFINDLMALEQQPTADAIKEAYDKGFEYGVKEWFESKTKTATWIYDKSIDGYYCSKCKTSHYKVMTPYCANCGAKMKKEKVND